MPRRLSLLLAIAAVMSPATLGAQSADSLVAPYPAELCRSCAGWSLPQRPFRIHGNSWFVGTRGLSAILITSPEGHVLIDGGLPNTAPMIMDNIRTLGFQVTDIRLILNSHAHFDHAGGLAAMQRASGARVAASAGSASVLARGKSGPDDPQYATLLDFPAVPVAEIVADGQSVQDGPILLTAHLTAGHTPGGTSWSWRSCEAGRCLDLVYADSQTPISSKGFRYSDSDSYPTAVADFERGFATLERLSCDVLITPHPGTPPLWERLAGGPDGLVDRGACRRYAASAREQLKRRLESEAATR